MKIRQAASQDAEKLSEIALAAKAYWQYPQRWLEIWRSALTISPEFIAANEVYMMTENEEIVGFYALSANGETAKLEHLWIAPEKIGLGIGQKLFAHAKEKAISLKVRKMEIDSDPNAVGFYQKMGAAQIGQIITEIEGEERVLPVMQIIL